MNNKKSHNLMNCFSIAIFVVIVVVVVVVVVDIEQAIQNTNG